MRKRTLYSLLAVSALVLALGVLVFLRLHAPPEVARLLPESDAIVYMNLKPVRAATHFDEKPVTLSADYARFLGATGFRWDRDLDRMAVALHRMPDPHGPNGPVAYTAVAEGRFDAARLTRFLEESSTSRETYAGHEVYTIPAQEGRVLRVTALGYDMVAASNMPTPEQVHSVLDRYTAGASPFSGSSVLAAHYRDVPYFALAWGIGHVGLPFSENGHVQVFGVSLPMSEDTDFIASLTFRGAVQLRIEDLAPTETEAAQTTQNLSTIVNLMRGFLPPGGTENEQALHRTFESMRVEQHRSRVVLTAEVPMQLVRNTTGAK